VQEALFRVAAIECEGCAGSIRRVLSKRAGVASVDVDVMEKTVRVAFDASRLTSGDLASALEAAGFPPATPDSGQ